MSLYHTCTALSFGIWLKKFLFFATYYFEILLENAIFSKLSHLNLSFLLISQEKSI